MQGRLGAATVGLSRCCCLRSASPRGLLRNQSSRKRVTSGRMTLNEQYSSACECLVVADIVAKVFLRHGSQILPGVGAAIDQRCGGPRRHTPNSQAILAAALRLYRAALVACFVLWREFCSWGFWDFCNKIGTKRPCRRGSSMSVLGVPELAA